MTKTECRGDAGFECPPLMTGLASEAEVVLGRLAKLLVAEAKVGEVPEVRDEDLLDELQVLDEHGSFQALKYDSKPAG